MHRAIACLALILFCPPLFARQEITPPTFGASPGAPIVATNGNTFLTLWTLNTNLGGKHVYGSLADANGKSLAPLAFLVIPNATVGALFASGSGYVAIISDGADIARTATLSNDGRLLSLGSPLPAIRTPYGPQPYVARAFNGREFFTVGYTDSNFPPGQTVAQVSGPDGSNFRQITLGNYARFGVVASGSEFVVATAEADGVFVHRFGSDGSERSPRILVSASTFPSVSLVAVASIENETAIAWTQQGTTGDTTHLSVVSREGSVIRDSQFEAKFTGALQLRSNATSYVLLMNGRSLRRFDRAGRLLAGPLELPEPAETVTIAATNTTIYAAGYKPYLLSPTVVGTPVAIAEAMTASAPTVLSTMLRRQFWPVLASDGAGFLAVWSDQTAESNLAAMRLDQNGAPLDAAQLDLGAANAPPDDRGDYFPRNIPTYQVVFGGSVYLVVWQRGSDVVMRRIDRSGKLLDLQPVVIHTNAYLTQGVSWTGSSFFVTWVEVEALRGAMVSEAGVVSPALDLGTGAGDVSWDGTRFLVATIEYSGLGVTANSGWKPSIEFCTTCTPRGLSLRRIAADGTPIDKAPVFLPLSTASIRIATSGREFVIASDVRRNDGLGEEYRYGIEVRTVRADGPVLQVSAPTTVFRWPQPTVSTIAWNGTQYALTWKYGLGTAQFVGLQHLSRDLARTDLLYAQLTPETHDPAALAANAAGQEILAVSEIATPASVARIRTFAPSEMKLTPAPPPTTLITSAVGTALSAIVTWQVSPTAILSGFIIEDSNPLYPNYAHAIAVAPPDVRSSTVVLSLYGNVPPQLSYVRMRTFNAGGISEPSASVHVVLPMRNRR